MPEVKFLGHSCITITEGDYKLIIDPFLSMNPQATTDMAHIDAKYILVTHGPRGGMSFLQAGSGCQKPTLGTMVIAGKGRSRCQTQRRNPKVPRMHPSVYFREENG